MKVNIGKYPSTKSKKPRKVEIKIDDWDTWDAGRNLALIAVPLLEKLKEDKQGSPFVDDEDVPEELRSSNSELSPNENLDSNFHKRWKWVLDEITYALTEVANEYPSEDKFYDHSEVDENSSIREQISAMKIDSEGLDQYNQRVQNGCRLFGVYFMSLWS